MERNEARRIRWYRKTSFSGVIEMEKLRIFRFRKEMIQKILEGKKTLTSRDRKYSGVYEIAYGSRFKPIRTGIIIYLTPLEYMEKNDIARNFYRDEGFDNPITCLKVLNELHPTKEWLWIHRIKLLESKPKALNTLKLQD